MMIQNQNNNPISASKPNIGGVNTTTADDASSVSPIDGRQVNKNEA